MQRFKDAEQQLAATLGKVRADDGASPALKAVVEELLDKTHQAVAELHDADERSIRDHVIEAEQAADSAKRAAEAESQITESTRRAVLEAHASLRALKADLEPI